MKRASVSARRLRMLCAGTLSLGMLASIPGVAFAAGDASLAEALKRQDMPAVAKLLKAAAKAEISATQPDGATALHWAAHWDDLATVDALLKGGANANAANDYGVTPLILAAQNGSLPVVQRLIKGGADVNSTAATGESVLMTSIRTGKLPVVKALLDAGANVNVSGGGRDQTPLMWATVRKEREIMKLLLAKGADVHAHSALRREYVSFSRGNPQGGRQIGLADATEDSDGSRPGLRWVNKGGFTPLLFAAQQNDLESAKILLAAGSNINDTTGIGYTSLMIAARNDFSELAAHLLAQGADPNVAEAGHTALHLAVARRNFDLMQGLIAKKADPNIRLTKGAPDPEGALRFNQLPEFLAGATPYLLAAALNEIPMMKALVAAGADPLTPMVDGTTPTMAAMGVFPGVFQFIPFVTIPANGARSDNPAYFARGVYFDEWSILETVKLTLELGVDINAERGNLTTYHVGNSRNLIGRGPGDTAIHIATVDKLYNVVEFLASKGARLDIKDRRGFTPLALAKSPNRQFQTGGGGEIIGDEGIAALLKQLGATE